jgi:hypothetical protein
MWGFLIAFVGVSRSGRELIFRMICSGLELICSRLELVCSRLELVCSRLELVCSRLKLICSRLKLICSRLKLICRRLKPINFPLEMIQIILSSIYSSNPRFIVRNALSSTSFNLNSDRVLTRIHWTFHNEKYDYHLKCMNHSVPSDKLAAKLFPFQQSSWSEPWSHRPAISITKLTTAYREFFLSLSHYISASFPNRFQCQNCTYRSPKKWMNTWKKVFYSIVSCKKLSRVSLNETFFRDELFIDLRQLLLGARKHRKKLLHQAAAGKSHKLQLENFRSVMQHFECKV